ncbi:hypothetical protein [Actinoplanes sp. TFC3]|uniref:hypothetical protein n=1 Tax=Actinoplanes sp. TFC3 TaxID=1710355 RepID=UPI000B201F9C|nr:hypothetical protein [Actinoplanes sp. TFC3]
MREYRSVAVRGVESEPATGARAGSAPGSRTGAAPVRAEQDALGPAERDAAGRAENDAPGPAAESGPLADGEAGPARRRWRPGRAELAVAAAYVSLAVIVVGRFLADPQGRITTQVPADHTWFEWLLSHGAYTVRHLGNPLFSARQNVPDGVNMMANTSVLGVTIPLAPLTMLAGPRITYLIWLAGAMVATSATTCWVLRRYVVRSRTAAAVAGAFAGFAPGVVHHANGQPNFVSNFLLPLIVARAVRLGRDGRWARDGILLALLVTWQLFLNEEMLLVTALACAVIVLVRLPKRRADFLRGLAVTAAGAAVLCAYPLWFQFAGPGSFRGVPMFNTWGEDPLTYLTFPRDSLAGDASSETVVGLIEQNSWFGWPLTLVAVLLAVLTWRLAVTRVAVTVALVFGLLALGPRLRFAGHLTGVPGPLAFLEEAVPVLDMMMPSRLTTAVAGAFTVLLAVGWDRYGRRRTLRRTVIAAALIPLIPTPVPAKAQRQPPVFITSGAWRSYVPPGGTMLPLPVPSNWLGRDTLSWSASERHEFAVPEGYFLGPGPQGEGQMGPATVSVTSRLTVAALSDGKVPVVSPADEQAVCADLSRWHTSVVVMRADLGSPALSKLAEQLYGPPTRVGDVDVWQPAHC